MYIRRLLLHEARCGHRLKSPEEEEAESGHSKDCSIGCRDSVAMKAAIGRIATARFARRIARGRWVADPTEFHRRGSSRDELDTECLAESVLAG